MIPRLTPSRLTDVRSRAMDVPVLGFEALRLVGFAPVVEKIDFSDYGGGVQLYVPDRDTGTFTRVTFSDQRPPSMFEGDEGRANWVRRALINAVTHEIDESLQLHGRRVFDPHAPEGDGRTGYRPFVGGAR